MFKRLFDLLCAYGEWLKTLGFSCLVEQISAVKSLHYCPGMWKRITAFEDFLKLWANLLLSLCCSYSAHYDALEF